MQKAGISSASRPCLSQCHVCEDAVYTVRVHDCHNLCGDNIIAKLAWPSAYHDCAAHTKVTLRL